MRVRDARFGTSSMFFLREEQSLASTDGPFNHQTLYRAFPQLSVTAVSTESNDFQSRASTDIAPMGLGYEHVLDADLVGNAPRWAEEAVRKLFAKPVDPGTYDLVL